jgi:uncharacterized protein YybS (DUF2232 family)
MSEGNVTRREDTETTQQRFPQQNVVLVVGALLFGFILAYVALIVGQKILEKICPRS